MMHHGHAYMHGRLGSALDEEAELGKVYDHRVVSRLARYMTPFKLHTTVAVVTMLVTSLSQVAVPWLIGRTIDQSIARADVSGLVWSVVALIGVVGAGWVTNTIYLMTMARISQRVLLRIRTQLFDHLQRLSLRFYDRN
ncbi:MAG: hypothetical protein HYX97_04995, partial [Chloroflexi bacterium]|nr:hypothetical protein [Chloroflexota bacterium]